MIEVEVLVDYFKDLENYSKETLVIRNGKQIKIQFQLLMKGDIYKISKKRFDILSKQGIVAKSKKESKEETEGQEPEGE